MSASVEAFTSPIDVTAGVMPTPQDLVDAFLGATVFAVRTADGEHPGVLMSGTRLSPVVFAWRSLDGLAMAVSARPDTPKTWVSMKGADLVELLPPGCGLFLDLGAATPVLLTPPMLAEAAGRVREQEGRDE